MSGFVWPADAVAGSPSYTGRMLRETSNSPMAGGATAARPLGGFSGCRPGTPSSIVTVTSTTWTVTPFAGTIDTEAAAIAGVYGFAFNANQTGSVTAAGGTARIDALDVQLSDPAESDGTSTPGIAIVYSVGTASAPALAARSFRLCTINVPASGGGSPTVTWNYAYTAAAGAILPVPTGVYPAGPYLGQYVDDAALGPLRYNGTTWVPVSGALSKVKPSSAVATGGTAVVSSSGRTTFTAVNAVNLLNLFATSSPLADYFEVELEILTTSGSPFITGVLGNGGTPVTSLNYDSNYNFRATTTNTPANQSATANWVLSAAGAAGRKSIRMRIENPNLAIPTTARVDGQEYSATAVPASFLGESGHRLSTAYTDLQFLASTGTMTGTVDVFGYSNS